jgi:hypothetical protein
VKFFLSLFCVVTFSPQPADFEETTIPDHEVKLLKESGQAALLSVAMSLFMSYKFSIHMSLLMQCLMMPITAYDSIVLKKYLFGRVIADDGSTRLYGELFSAPTAASLAAAERATAAVAERAAREASDAPGPAPGPIGKDEPRVEELPDEDEAAVNKAKNAKDTKTATAAESEKSSGKATPAAELD